jgi:hypothetical protein
MHPYNSLKKRISDVPIFMIAPFIHAQYQHAYRITAHIWLLL